MSLNQLLGIIVTAWLCVTVGLVTLIGSYGIIPLSAGIALSVVAWVYVRKFYYEELYGKREDKP